MSTRAQRAANRRNAQASTGPVTDAGKEASSQNARIHGCSSSEFSVLPGEDPSDFVKLVERLTTEMKPATEHEGFLVALMAQSRWKRGRIEIHEMKLLDQLIEGEPVEARIALMMRYAAAAERSYYKAHRELTQSRRERESEVRTAFDKEMENYIMAPPGQARAVYARASAPAEVAPQPQMASFGRAAGSSDKRL